MNFTVTVFQGNEILSWVDLIANLRVIEFKKFPYLYSGNFDIEKKYLAAYAKDDHSLFTLVFCDNEVVGALTGIPLLTGAEVLPNVSEIFEQKGLDLRNYYYYGEFIVLSKYRNLGVARKLLNEQTNRVKSLGYKSLCLATVDGEDNHLLKPKDYIDTDIIWEKFGFTKTDMQIQVEWPTFMIDGSVVDATHFLTFWIKEKI